MFRTVFVTIIIVWVSAVTTYAQYLAPGYTMQKWSIEEGLPVNSVNRVIQAKDGYLYIATSSGLVRFDGTNFKVYSSANYPGLNGNRLLQLVESSDGSILIQNQGSSSFAFKDEKFTPLSTANQVLVGEASAEPFYKDLNNHIWFGDDTGLNVFTDGALEKFETQLINKPVERVFLVENGMVWFKYFDDSFLYLYENGMIKKILDVNENLQHDLNRLFGSSWSTLVSQDNKVWISTRSEIYSYADNTLSLEYKTDDLVFSDLIVDENGNVNISTVPINGDLNEQAIFVLNDGKMEPTDYQDIGVVRSHATTLTDHFWLVTNKEIFKDGELIFSTDASIEDLIVDSEGSLWIGTLRTGLIQLKKNLFSTLSSDQGLTTNNIYTVLQTRDSTIWVGTFGSGINQIQSDGVHSDFTIQQGNKGHILTLEELQDGRLLLGGLFAGLFYYDNKSRTFNRYPANDLIDEYSVHSIFEDSQKRLWVGTSPRGGRGLFLRDGNHWELIAGKDNVPFGTYQFIMEAPNGDVWFSARSAGLVRFDGTNYHNYTTKDGLSSDFIRAIYIYIDEVSGEEVLLIGTEGEGLDRITLTGGAPDFATLTRINKSNGLYDNSIHIILEDDFERLWMNTNQGIFWINKSDIQDLYTGDIESISSTSYTENDGLLNREGNGGSQPSGIKAFDGSLWFPGQGGLTSVNPRDIQQNQTPPPLHIQSASSGNAFLPISESRIGLEPNQRNFDISYAALSFIQPQKNRYRYKLEGFDNRWQEVGTRKTAYFTNVPAGRYTFIVQGSNNDDVWNTEGATLIVTIAPYFYETSFFYIIFGLSVIGCIFWVVSLREKQAKKKQLELENIILERTEDLIKEKEEVEHQKAINDELSHAKDTFFTNISHELRTPLTLVLGPLQSLAQNSEHLPEKWSRQLKIARRNGYRLKQLVEQVLDLARLESSKMEISPVKVDINAKVRLLVESFESLATSKKIKLAIDVPDSETCAGIDIDKFQKIIINLITNALKFTLPNGTISVSVEVIDGFVNLVVADTGIGIEKERLPYIFDRFHTKEKNSSNSGFGLGVGLNLTKEFVELHGGSISVESQLGKGTRFLVVLKSCDRTMQDVNMQPIQLDHEEAAIFEVPDPVVSIPKKGEQKKTHVLLVEDNRDMRLYISQLLDAEKIHVTEAENGVEGKKQLSMIKPDLIISDVMMPDMDGFEFSQYVRSVPEYRLTPIMMLTALSDLDNRLQAFDIGVSDYLTKPFIEQELKVRINNLLRLKYERDQAIAKSSTTEEEELSDDAAFAKKLQTYVLDNIRNTQISVEELGAIANMSRRQFYRKLKTKTGFTPAEFVKEIRLFKAREIIENRRAQSISEVAYAVGFSTPSYFTKVYEERFGTRVSSLLRS